MSGGNSYNKIISTVNSVTSDYQMIVDQSNIITIDTSNNRIGIGTLDPETSLHIRGNEHSGIRTTNLEICGGFVKSSLIPDNFDYSDSIFTEPSNNNYKNHFSLGDPSNPWHSIHCISGNFQDVYLGTNTLYIGGKPVLGADDSGNIKLGFEEQGYDIKLGAKFTDIPINGNLNFVSNTNTPRHITSQSNIIIDPSGIGDNTGVVTIKGDLIVEGNRITITSNVLDISDNIITLNKGYDSQNPISISNSGIEIDKGQSTSKASLLYYIDEDNWEFSGSGGLKIPHGTDNTRDISRGAGTIRYNTDLKSFEGYNDTNWGTLGGVISVDKKTKIIPETQPDASNNQLDFFTNDNHIMRLDESGNLLLGDISNSNIRFNIENNNGNITTQGNIIPINTNQNIGDDTHSWKNIYIGDGNSNPADNSSNAIYLNNTKIIYFDETGKLILNNPEGSVKVPANFDVDGDASFNSDVEISNNLIVNNDGSFNANVNILNDLTVNDNTIIYKRFDLHGDASFNNDVEISNNLVVNGDASFNSDVDISNDLHVHNILQVDQNVYMSNLLDVSGNVLVKDNLFVYNRTNLLSDVSMNNNVDISANLNVNNDLTVYNKTNLLSDVSMNNNVDICGNLVVTSTSTFNGPSSFNDPITFNDKPTFNSDMFISNSRNLVFRGLGQYKSNVQCAMFNGNIGNDSTIKTLTYLVQDNWNCLQFRINYSLCHYSFGQPNGTGVAYGVLFMEGQTTQTNGENSNFIKIEKRGNHNQINFQVDRVPDAFPDTNTGTLNIKYYCSNSNTVRLSCMIQVIGAACQFL